jgi:SAM-dependent methyltransferase
MIGDLADRGWDKETIDTTVPRIDRYRWPKVTPTLSPAQSELADDFMRYWHEVLPRRFGTIEKFNHGYALRFLPEIDRWRTLELGAGIGGHLEFEPLTRQEYHCVELREGMSAEVRRRFPTVTTVTGDCQTRIPYESSFFDRVLVIHVLEHLPNLPAALAEVRRVLKPGGLFSVVLPCDPGLAYALARKISAERLFRKRYKLPYGWLIRREHINSPGEILYLLKKLFDVIDETFFPMRMIPMINANLCIGVTGKKPWSA